MADEYGVDFKLTVNLENVRDKLEALADRCHDLDTPLLRAGGVIRSRVHRIFAAEGPGWPALAAATLAKKPNMAWVRIHQDLGRGRTGQRTILQRVVREHKGARHWLDRQTQINKQIDAVEQTWRSKLPEKKKARERAEEKVQKAVELLRSYMEKEPPERFQAEPLLSGKVVAATASLKKYRARAAMIDRGIAGPRIQTKERRLAATIVKERNYLAKLRVYANLGERVGSQLEGKLGLPPRGIKPERLADYAYREVARAKAHGQVIKRYKALVRPGIRERGILGYKTTPIVLSDRERRKMLRQHARRYKATESSTRMLGNLDQTIGMKLLGHGGVRVYSSAFISGIHNKGGIAGHGAVIPKREFIALQDSDAQMLAQFILEELMEEFERAA